ncbi:MAG: efflux RND transporter periplasmic adaptor subunit [Hyalangium sp.]|uniref:efflux RND transporter periplasmic adaptor subunit n=1 Tax=Hyalangium sp. TaxID=2028555 RepID=UPI00389ACBC5
MRNSFLLSLLCAGAVVACKQAPPAEEAQPHPRVRVAQAQPGPAALSVTVAGVLAAPPGRDVKLAPLVPGRLARLLVTEGDSVRADQVLGEVETGPVTDELQQAEATARESEAAVQAAESKRTRTEVLVEHGVAAREEAEQARSAEAAARAALQRAQAALDQAHRKVRHSELKAPFNGVVTAVFIRQGETVDGAGQPVLQVAAIDPLELRAFVAPAQAAQLRPGMRATLIVQGLSDAPAGEVIKVSPAIDAQSGNILVRVGFANPAAQLRIGSLGRARIITGEEKGAVTVPASALLPQEDGGLGVALVQEGKVHSLPVTVRSEEAGQAVVQGELKGGEALIVEGGYSLPDGAEVEVVR